MKCQLPYAESMTSIVRNSVRSAK